MKSKVVGYALSALFVVVVIALVFRISTVKNWVIGSTSAPAA